MKRIHHLRSVPTERRTIVSQNVREVPTHVPDGVRHVAFTLCEAEASFQMGNTKDGVANLAHAFFVLASKREEMGADEARSWFRRITAAADCWSTE